MLWKNFALLFVNVLILPSLAMKTMSGDNGLFAKMSAASDQLVSPPSPRPAFRQRGSVMSWLTGLQRRLHVGDRAVLQHRLPVLRPEHQAHLRQCHRPAVPLRAPAAGRPRVRRRLRPARRPFPDAGLCELGDAGQRGSGAEQRALQGALMRCPQPGGVTLFNSVTLNHSVRDAGLQPEPSLLPPDHGRQPRPGRFRRHPEAGGQLRAQPQRLVHVLLRAVGAALKR